MKTKYLSIGAALMTWLLAGCHREEQIQSYSAPKEPPAAAPTQVAPAPSMTGADASPVPVNSAPVHWTTPAAWREIAPTTIRIGNFVVPGAGDKKAEVSVTSFPGDVGGALANVNRWRQENGLGEITDSPPASQPVSVDSVDGKLYDISGATARTVVAMIPRAGATWFFKMRGDPETVAGAQPTFLEFLKSVHFGGASHFAGATSAQPAPIPPAMPEMAATPASGPDSAPKWEVPSNWTETPAGPMVVKSFSVSGDAGQKANVSISVFGGGAGGILANVNRWRGQINLPAIEEAALPASTEPLDVAGVKATLVDFTGADKAGQPSRLLAAIVAHGDETWFYKLTGDGPLVGREKANFVKLVQSVHY
ncbi:MAG: hypothetical protein ABSA47_15600 [Verrucomicrobiota bacterium]